MAELPEKSSRNPYYTVEAPGRLYSNTTYNVAISILEASGPCHIKITLSGGDFWAEKTKEVLPRSTDITSFKIPDINDKEDYYLEAEGLKGIEFKDKIKLLSEVSKPMVYIQLDKQAYKHDDAVDYRVICLDRIVRPVELANNIKLLIEDQGGASIAEITDVKLTNGVHMGKWVIPADKTLKGNFNLKVYVDDQQVCCKGFEIIASNPSKFSITIKTKKIVPYAQGQVKIAVDAACIEKSVQFEGSAENIFFDIVDDLCIDENFMKIDYFSSTSISLKVKVVEEKTNLEETELELVTISKTGKPMDDDFYVSGGCVKCGFNAGKVQLEISKTNFGDADSREASPSADDELETCDNCDECCEMESEPDEDDSRDFITIAMAERRYQVGDQLKFIINLKKPTDYFIYFVTTRGNISASDFVRVRDYKEPQIVALPATFEYVPRAFMLVYYVSEGELCFSELGFDLLKIFENPLTCQLPCHAAAGDIIRFDIKSTPNSLIGLMAVDKNSILIGAKNDLDYYKVFEDLFFIRSETPLLNGTGDYPGLTSGLVTFTNATWSGFQRGDPDAMLQRIRDQEHMEYVFANRCFDGAKQEKLFKEELQKRRQVLGNWFFVNKLTDSNGHLCFEEKFPETPTKWLVTTFSVHPLTGFAMLQEPVEIQALFENKTRESNHYPEEFQKTRAMVMDFEVNHYEESEFKNSLSIELSADKKPIVNEFTISTNLLGPTLADLHQYAGIMYGTGHLHMTTFFPNVVVLEFLENRNQLNSDIAATIKKRLPEAIARELSDKSAPSEGWFSWFASDEVGSPHVTSLVMQAFQRAAKFVEVDKQVIARGLAYLASLQLDSGEVAAEKEPYHFPFQEDSGVGLTAVVLLAFLQDKTNTDEYRNFIDKAFDYIISNIETIYVTYDLALSFYAMQLYKHPYASVLMERLQNFACIESAKKLKWWTYTKEEDEPSSGESTYHPVSDVEVTSYVLLGLLETETIEDALEVAKWLLSPYGEPIALGRNESMDCAVSVDAVLQFAIRSGDIFGVTNVKYTALDSDNLELLCGEISLEPENSIVIHAHMLPPNTQRIEFSTQEKGTFFGNLTSRYLK